MSSRSKADQLPRRSTIQYSFVPLWFSPHQLKLIPSVTKAFVFLQKIYHRARVKSSGVTFQKDGGKGEIFWQIVYLYCSLCKSKRPPCVKGAVTVRWLGDCFKKFRTYWLLQNIKAVLIQSLRLFEPPPFAQVRLWCGRNYLDFFDNLASGLNVSGHTAPAKITSRK